MNVFVADGHFLSREGVKNILLSNQNCELVGEAVNKIEILKNLRSQKIDLLIIDPKSVLGFKNEILNQITNEYPFTKVLIIGGEYSQVDVVEIIQSGVTAFVTKHCSKAEILKAIDFAMLGEKFFCNKVIELMISKNKPSENSNCDPSVLTDRETEILKMIGEGLTTTKIAEKLNLSIHTINTHRKNISKKLQINTPAQMVKYAVEADL
jgi:DNA-binding NarL/FixJ family response regulator